MLENVQQTTIEPIINQTILAGTLIYTDEYNIYARLQQRAMTIKRLITTSENMHAMKTVTAFMKFTSILKPILYRYFVTNFKSFLYKHVIYF